MQDNQQQQDKPGQYNGNDRKEDYQLPGIRESKALFHTVETLFDWLSTTVEVFTRFEFGERYLGWIRLFVAWTIIGTFFYVPLFVGHLSISMALFCMVFVVVSLAHRARIWWRVRTGMRWHSRSIGISIFSPIEEEIRKNLPTFSKWAGFDEMMFFRFAEPAVPIFIGIVMIRVHGFLPSPQTGYLPFFASIKNTVPYILFDPALGTWLAVSGVALLFKNNMLYSELRGRTLDIIDAQIEMAYQAAAIAGKSKYETAGYSLVRMPEGHFERPATPPIDPQAAVAEVISEAQLPLPEPIGTPRRPEPKPKVKAA